MKKLSICNSIKALNVVFTSNHLARRLFIVLVFWIILFFGGTSFAYENKRVCFISSYHPGFPTFFDQIEGIKFILDKTNTLIDIEYMDTKRFPQRDQWTIFQNALSYKLNHTNPYDAVIVADDNALIFAIEQQKKLFMNTPIVFMGVNNIDRALDQNKNPQITGVVEAVSMVETIELMIKFRPAAKRIVAIVDNTPSGQGDLKKFYKAAEQFKLHEFSELSLADKSWPDFLNSLSSYDENNSLLLLSAYKDIRSKTYLFEESLNKIRKATKLPIFHLWYHGIGDGLIGGKVISHFEQGKAAAQITLKILSGISTSEIEIKKQSPNRYVFDYSELKRNNINQKLLPNDSLILNEPDSFYKKNKKTIWALVTLIFILSTALFISIANILKRRKAEKELKKSIIILNEAQKIAHIGHFDYDIVNEKLNWSSELFRIFDKNEDSFNPTFDGYFSLVHNEDRDFANEEYSKSITNKTSFDFDVRIFLDDGTIKHIQNKGKNEYDQSGKAVRTVGMILDITDQKLAEVEQEQLQTKLRQAQKMEAVGRLAGGVAHDFNNMLSIILGNSEIVLEDIESDNPLIQNINEIQKAARRSSDLTRQLLAFARKQTISPRILDLNATIEGMLRMLRRLIGEDIDLSWRPKNGLWKIRIDPSQVDQILANLCVNARDAIQNVGKVTIETDNIQLEDHSFQQNMDFKPGDYVVLLVSDNGCGMDKETVDNLFEPFFTTKEVGEGTGLGMATVYGIVRQNNGFINVYSELEKGTTFKIYLPKQVQKQDDRVQKISEKKILKGDETILLVEDEKAILDTTQMMLERLGYRVLPALSPEDALEVAKKRMPDDIHLLMTDVVMPKMNGRDLSKELIKLCPNLKCLFMSGYTANVIAHHGVLDEGLNFINKPYSKQDLSIKLREILDESSI